MTPAPDRHHQETDMPPEFAEVIALLPCPFCGGAAADHQGHADITYITCDTCGAVASFRPHMKGGKARNLWNTRTHPTPSPGLGEEWLLDLDDVLVNASVGRTDEQIIRVAREMVNAALAQPSEGAAP